MHALSTTLNTKSMVKPNTLVYFVTQLHTCPHAEPDKTISHFIVYIILHHKMVTLSRFRMRQIPLKDFFCKFYPEMYYSIHTYQSTESTKITGETYNSLPKMEYNVHISKLVSILFLTKSLWIYCV